jgi:hypothetical protein
MIPHWITLPLYSLLVLLATATTIWAGENQVYECNAYLTEKNAKEQKDCGNMVLETKNPERGSYVYSACGSVMLRFATKAEASGSITHVQLLKLTAAEVKAAQEKRDITEPKILTSLSLPEDLLPRVFALSHRDEQRLLTASCHKAQ